MCCLLIFSVKSLEIYKMFTNTLKILSILALWALTSCESYTPIVYWHGLGDTCCSPLYSGRVVKHLKEYLPGVHIVSFQIGRSELEDFLNGFIMHPDKQIEFACNRIQSDPLLANGFNAIGVSLGAVLMRGLAQRCPQPRMKTLITMAGPQQGNYGLPLCNTMFIPLCDVLRRAFSPVFYSSSVQKHFVPASFWHDPLHEERYKEKNSYVADINNEKTINETYIKNLQLLEKFVMVKYTKEDQIQPPESEWFGFYKPGQSKEIQTLQESDLYISDRLGLKQMDNDGKLDFLMAPWFHIQFDWSWFRENIADKYLI